MLLQVVNWKTNHCSEVITLLCLLAGNYLEAKTWAYGQQLDESEWFYPIDIHELKHRTGFHVLVIGTAGHNVPSSYFERVLSLAKRQGRIGR